MIHWGRFTTWGGITLGLTDAENSTRNMNDATSEKRPTSTIVKILVGVGLTLACLLIVLVMLFVNAFRDKRPSIYFATAKGNTNYVSQYLASGHDVNDAVLVHPHGGDDFAPLLDVAVSYGQLDTVEFLLKIGANPNQRDSRGHTPLDWTIGQIRDEVGNDTRLQGLKLLLHAGADPN